MSDGWTQVAALFLANAGLILWFRSESRSDWRHMDAKIDAIHEEMQDFRQLVLEEMRDFHGRLCTIEERNRDKK